MSRFPLVAALVAFLSLSALVLHHFVLGATLLVALLVVTGLGVAIPQLQMFGPFLCRAAGARMQVALTFDDGPDPRSTPQLLDLLRREQVPVAFFCVGQRVETHPELAARMVREGHLAENHSFAHSNFTNFYSRARLREELGRAQRAIESACGVAPTFFRPPVGLSNPNTFRAAGDLHLRTVGWNVRSLDTVFSDSQRIVARVRRALTPGSIILLHDGNIPPDRLLHTVKSLLDTLRTLGYQVVRLDELLK